MRQVEAGHERTVMMTPKGGRYRPFEAIVMAQQKNLFELHRYGDSGSPVMFWAQASAELHQLCLSAGI
jgi:hypothetical protein